MFEHQSKFTNNIHKYEEKINELTSLRNQIEEQKRKLLEEKNEIEKHYNNSHSEILNLQQEN